MSLTGEGATTPEKPALKSDSYYFKSTAGKLFGILEEKKRGIAQSVNNRMRFEDADQIEGQVAQKAKIAASELMRANASDIRKKDAPDLSTARVLETMGLAIEASQSDDPVRRGGAQEDLVKNGLLNPAQSVKFAEYLDGLRATRNSDPSGRSYIGFMDDQMSRMNSSEDEDGALELAVMTATAWSMQDPEYADEAYARMSGYIA